ncbi:MAG: succinyldiaminopimelate transaminase [Thiolinea sp.]
MNPDLTRLQPYPFEKIRTLLGGLTPPTDLPAISLAIGEPKHATPDLIKQAVTDNLVGLNGYPPTKGTPILRSAIAEWLTKRFQLPAHSIDPDQHILPVNGTREALFSFAQVILDRTPDSAVLMPNPFYQIYEGAALLAGSEPVFLNCTADNGFIPDFDEIPAAMWDRCQLLYTCTPGNPTGAVMSLKTMQRLIELAEKHDFLIASDECYSELYFDEKNPPAGLLQAATLMGNTEYKHCLVFNSLSKRSNAPGMRSGFIAGDKDVLAQYLLYRTYHGCAMPPTFQAASTAAWQDEIHVIENRALYRSKFASVMKILQPVMDIRMPDAGFFLWPQIPIADDIFTQQLYTQQHVNVVPGSYLSRDTPTGNPGQNRVRMALVATEAECIEAAHRISRFMTGL